MNVYKHKNYKGFLRDYIQKLPGKGRGEITRIAKYLGVSSTLLSQIFSKDRDLSLEQAKGLSDYLGLAPIDSDYFMMMVHFERAGSGALKKYYEQKIFKLREEALQISNRVEPTKSLTDQERSVFYSSHLFASIWLFTSTDQNGKTIDQVANYFELPRDKTIEIIQFLFATGLCVEKNGRYLMGTQSTHVEQGSPYLLHHYRNWRIQAIQRSETLSSEELMYSAAVSLSEKDFEILREEMAIFIKDFLAKTHASPAEKLACFNLDFFWIKN